MKRQSNRITLPSWRGPSPKDDYTLLKAALHRFHTKAAGDGVAHSYNILQGEQPGSPSLSGQGRLSQTLGH